MTPKGFDTRDKFTLKKGAIPSVFDQRNIFLPIPDDVITKYLQTPSDITMTKEYDTSLKKGAILFHDQCLNKAIPFNLYLKTSSSDVMSLKKYDTLEIGAIPSLVFDNRNIAQPFLTTESFRKDFFPASTVTLKRIIVFVNHTVTNTRLIYLLLSFGTTSNQSNLFTEKFWSHIVNGVVSDGATINRKLWSELGVTGEKGKITNTFEHPLNNKRKNFMILVASHLLKNIHNRLYHKKRLKESPDSNYIRWSHYVEVHKNDIERDSFAPLRVCPKITQRHLTPDSFSKMNVKLVTQ